MSCATTLTRNELEDRIIVMVGQESSISYKVTDYIFHQLRHERESPIMNLVAEEESWRERICEWLYNVVDHFNYRREIVSIALNFFDRYLSNCEKDCIGVDKSKLFQLLAVSALHIALKMHESNVDHLPTLVKLSRDFFTARHIVSMERSILKSLSWRLSPPTPLAFLHHFLLLMPKEDQCSNVHLEISDCARFLVELSVCDYYFVRNGIKPSSVALASLINASHLTLPGSPASKKAATCKLMSGFESLVGIRNSKEIKKSQDRLYEIFKKSGHGSQHRESSPVSVTRKPPTTRSNHCNKRLEKGGAMGISPWNREEEVV